MPNRTLRDRVRKEMTVQATTKQEAADDHARREQTITISRIQTLTVSYQGVYYGHSWIGIVRRVGREYSKGVVGRILIPVCAVRELVAALEETSVAAEQAFTSPRGKRRRYLCCQKRGDTHD